MRMRDAHQDPDFPFIADPEPNFDYNNFYSFSLKTDVHLPSKSNKQKKIFVGILSTTDEKKAGSGAGDGSESVSQWYRLRCAPPLNVFVCEAGEADAPVPLELNPEDEVVEVRQVPRGQLIHRLQRD
jgi:hypothetical protein